MKGLFISLLLVFALFLGVFPIIGYIPSVLEAFLIGIVAGVIGIFFD